MLFYRYMKLFVVFLFFFLTDEILLPVASEGI